MSLEPETLTACCPIRTEPTEVVMNTRYLHQGFTRFRQMLIVLTQTPITPQPRKRPFHYPTAPQRHKTLLPRRPTHDPNPVGTMMRPQPAIQRGVVILVVGLHHFQAREVGTRHLGEQLRSGPRIIHVGGRDHDRQQQAHRIHDDMAFAAADLLAAVGSHFRAPLGRLDRLTVDAGDAGSRIAASLRTNTPAKDVEQAVPGAVLLPLLEIVVDGFPGRQIIGQSSPRATLAGKVQDGVDDFTHIGLARSPARLSGRYPGFQDSPLAVHQVGRVAFAFHTAFYANAPFWNRLLVADSLRRTVSSRASLSTLSYFATVCALFAGCIHVRSMSVVSTWPAWNPG